MVSIIDSNCFADFSYLSRLLRTEAVKFKGDMASLFAGMYNYVETLNMYCS